MGKWFAAWFAKVRSNPPTPAQTLFAVVQGSILLFTFFGTFTLALKGHSATPFAVVGLVALLLLRFGEIADINLEAFGVKGALRRANRATEDAERATEALRELGVELARVVLGLQALQGHGTMMTTTSKYAVRNDIIVRLKEVGADSDQLDSVMNLFNLFFLRELIYQAAEASQDYDCREQASFMIAHMHPEEVQIEVFRNAFTTMGCLTPLASKWLEKAEHFQRTGEFDESGLDEEDASTDEERPSDENSA